MTKPAASSQQPVARRIRPSFLLQATSYRLQAGFTLIELLVVCGIMVVVTAIILASNSQYGGQVLLQNFAYDAALSIRQAQVYGISVQRFGSGARAFSSGYGVHFYSKDNTHYELFADLNGNGIYDTGEMVGRQYTIGGNYSISKICAPASDIAAGAAATCKGITQLDILFIRPEPDAWITANGGSGGSPCIPANTAGCEGSARIVLRSPRGATMSVTVSANGQIAVDQTSAITP